jgi:hypothetical protein
LRAIGCTPGCLLGGLLLGGSSLAQSPAVIVNTQGAQTASPPAAEHSGGSIAGMITDTDHAAIPGAKVELELAETKEHKGDAATDATGAFSFEGVAPGTYRLRIRAEGFASWKVEGIDVQAGNVSQITPVELGVESLDSTVNAITVEDLAEQQVTAEEHQRILGILPNFYVSYLHGRAQPLTIRQKFRLAFVVSTDPLTFVTTGINAGIEQAQGDFTGYGPGFAGYARRYGAAYGDRVDSTFLGAALLPSLFRQDPRYFYKGSGNVAVRALYAIATVVICRGDNGRWQPNYSNVLGNLAAGGISSLYYPRSDQHTLQVTVDNTLLGTAEGAIGTLFQEFLLKHVTKGVPAGSQP